MRKDKIFIEQIIKNFPDRFSNECLSISNLEIDYVQDNEENQKCYFTENQKVGFKIINNKKQEINLFSLDGCFFTYKDVKRCDCIIFNNIDLCFCELKLNVESVKGDKKRRHFDYAIEQLESSINFFKTNLNQDYSFFNEFNTKHIL